MIHVLGSVWEVYMQQAAFLYNLKDEFIRCIEMGDYGNISERKWLIKSIVWEHERCSWRASCLMCPSLDIYCQTVKDIRLDMCADKFSHFTAKISTVVSLLLGTLPKGTSEKAYNCVTNIMLKPLIMFLHKKHKNIFPTLTENMPLAMAGVFNQGCH